MLNWIKTDPVDPSFRGVFDYKSKSEIKPVEPGQGNACEGKNWSYFSTARIASAFFNGKTKKDEEDFFSTTVFERSFSL